MNTYCPNKSATRYKIYALLMAGSGCIKTNDPIGKAEDIQEKIEDEDAFTGWQNEIRNMVSSFYHTK